MTIGVLVPRSGLFPSISFDIAEGIKAGLNHKGINDAVISVENIGFANNNTTIYAICEKLLMNGADAVAGYVNPATAEALNPLFKTAGKIFITLDPGYHIPSGLGPLSNVINLSLQGAFCCRVLAKIANNNGVTNAAFATSFYDAGYRSGLAYAAGLFDHGGSIVFNHVTALKKSDFNLEPLHRFLEAQPADAVLASFCGDMGEDFFKHAKEKELHNKTAIYCSPFMAEETLLDSVEYLGKDADTVVPWSKELVNDENTIFKDTMAQRNRQANIMSLLGWEAALVISAVKDRALNECAELELQSPRGKVKCGTAMRISEAPVYTGKIIANEKNFSKLALDNNTGSAEEAERKRWYENITEASKAQMDTWHNAYLCIE